VIWFGAHPKALILVSSFRSAVWSKWIVCVSDARLKAGSPTKCPLCSQLISAAELQDHVTEEARKLRQLFDRFIFVFSVYNVSQNGFVLVSGENWRLEVKEKRRWVTSNWIQMPKTVPRCCKVSETGNGTVHKVKNKFRYRCYRKVCTRIKPCILYAATSIKSSTDFLCNQYL